jgi:hypothetical protein
MINIGDHKQLPLFEPWGHLGDKCRKLIDESWAGIFQREILPILPVKELFPYFSDKTGRPTKDLHTVIGVLIFQQSLDLTDQETVMQLASNTQWHYALNIFSPSDAAAYMSLKTLWNNRDLILSNELDKVIFEKIRDKLADTFGVDTTKQRLDSVHIKSNMHKLGRIGIISQSIHGFLNILNKKYTVQFGTVEEEIIKRYHSEKAVGCFSRVKPSESPKTLDTVSSDLYKLVIQFENDSAICGTKHYKILKRVLSEQCNVVENVAAPKDKKQIASDSLQNPSDPDATYSGHKGQGFQAQIMETYTENKQKTDLNLITYIEAEPAHKSDAKALIPALESVKEQNMLPKQVLADALYGSDDNIQKAEKLGVDVVSPVMGGSKENPLQLFNLSDNGTIQSCPQGHTPLKTKSKNGKYSASFNSETCSQCPMKDTCLSKQRKKYHYVNYSDKNLRLSRRRQYEESQEFKEKYRYRSGVEATMSQYDRLTGVKHLRVRGLKAVRYCAVMKAAALNIFRAAMVRIARNRAEAGRLSPNCSLKLLIKIFKELLAFFEPHFYSEKIINYEQAS